ncbi:MAG: hypothetical protein D6722_18175 [Bacteroidetes bacterium]|nr:MAG: hypothetical protein D6722_18175 [Bacteroidota bacterium]
MGLAILFCLFFYPELGIDLFWNLLIPLAPALLVLALGVWRNLCPMAFTSLLPRHWGTSQRKTLTPTQTSRLNLMGVLALFLIVPLRHAFFDLNGPATGLLVLSLGAVAFGLGFFYEWKSAWCSGLCPVHPVEKLYGLTNRLTLPNAHCGACHQCVRPCPDSTPGINPLSLKKTLTQKTSGYLMAGAFPGFVWGWFQVPDSHGVSSWGELLGLYHMPVMGLLASGGLFLLLNRFVEEKRLIAVFAAAAVSCYYWFRLPALFGYGVFPGDGLLVDVSAILPEWVFTLATVALSVFLFWWIVVNQKRKASWVVRPAFARTNNRRT